MGFLKVLACLAMVWCVSQGSNVNYMEMENSHVYGSFSWENCRSTDPIQIKEFSLSPDPLNEKHNASVSLHTDVTQNIVAPIKMSVSIKVFVQGGQWVEVCDMIPDMDKCILYDLCKFLKKLPTCPKIFTDQGLDCKCPIKKGTYGTKQPVTFFIPDLPVAGIVHVHLELLKSKDDSPLGCIDFMMTLVD